MLSVEDARRRLKAWSVKVQPGRGPELMDDIVKRARAGGNEVLVLEGAMVFGKDHLASALHHASRAIEEGTNSSDSLLMETILYASGERQLGTAIKKMSVSETTQELVVAQLADVSAEPGPDWTELPRVATAADSIRLTRFGISEQEMQTMREPSPTELVLEKVAAVDVLKR